VLLEALACGTPVVASRLPRRADAGRRRPHRLPRRSR
jgi:hypothetical protein